MFLFFIYLYVSSYSFLNNKLNSTKTNCEIKVQVSKLFGVADHKKRESLISLDMVMINEEIFLLNNIFDYL